MEEEAKNLLFEAMKLKTIPQLDFVAYYEHPKKLLAGEIPKGFDIPYYRTLIKAFGTNGSTQKYKAIKRETAALYAETSRLRDFIANKRAELYNSHGLNSGGNYKPGEHPDSLLGKTSAWKKYQKVDPAKRPSVENLFLLERWLANEWQREEDKWMRGEAPNGLLDLVATNYALALCCDDSECARSFNAQMRLRDREKSRKKEDAPAAAESISAD